MFSETVLKNIGKYFTGNILYIVTFIFSYFNSWRRLQYTDGPKLT